MVGPPLRGQTAKRNDMDLRVGEHQKLKELVHTAAYDLALASLATFPA